MNINQKTFELSKNWIYRNARPLELARWQYHFEQGSKEEVLKALSYYQNEDGGFGHALEPDSWNPNSTPIQTWAATEIIKEINIIDGNNPIVEGILKYLQSGKDFDKQHNQWLNVVPTNNNFPHAIWWEYKKDNEFKYNPTACLAGFIIRFADENSLIYKRACEIAKQAFEFLISKEPFGEQHVIGCFISLYEYCILSGKTALFNTEFLAKKLKEQVNFNICKETEKWGIEYVSVPSNFINSKNSIFYSDNRELADYQCEFIIGSQLDDGSYPVPFQWWTDYKEAEITMNWWKSYDIIANMLYLKGVLG